MITNDHSCISDYCSMGFMDSAPQFQIKLILVGTLYIFKRNRDVLRRVIIGHTMDNDFWTKLLSMAFDQTDKFYFISITMALVLCN